MATDERNEKAGEAEKVPEPTPEVKKFRDVFATERALIRSRRTERRSISKESSISKAPSVSKEPSAAAETVHGEAVVGLSLSGGGIRSAAFSLGAIQSLEAQGAFAEIDFLSMVSGGGYIGAALLAGKARRCGAFPFDAAAVDAGSLAAADIADNPEVRGLRDRCRYLMPDGKFDLVISLAIILRGLAVNATMVAVPLFLAAALTLFAYPSIESLDRPAAFRALVGVMPALVEHWAALFGSAMPVSIALGLLLVVWLVVWAIWRSLTASASRSGDTSADPRSPPARATAYLLVAWGVIVVLELQPVVLWYATRSEFPAWMPKLSHAIAALSAGTGVFALTWKALLGRIQASAASPEWQATVQRIGAHLAITLLAAALPLAIYLAYLGLVGWGMTCAPSTCLALPSASVVPLLLGSWAALAGLAIWSAAVGPLCTTIFARSWWQGSSATTSRTIAASIGALAAVVAIFVAGGLFADRLTSLSNDRYASVICLGVAAAAAIVAGLFSENANSLHRLYRDRLSEAFELGGGVDRTASLPLSKLGSASPGGASIRPYPILNAAVNLQGSRNDRRQRNADFFVFTPDHVGSDATGYVATTDMEIKERHLDLATAAAISGAAVSSVMGRSGSALMAPTLALLNIRLGYWLANPRYVGIRDSFLPPAVAIREWRLSYLVNETFGFLDETLAKVYLTDGGHIDNLGLYQLLKRRCDVIFVVDAEADPAMNFSAFVDVERFARIDLGVRMELPWQSVRKEALARRAALKKDPACDAASPPHAHAAIGKILYPPVEVDGKVLEEGKEGYLLYVKASMTGDERGYVLDYERRHPSFPHESTGDQFFSEEQFEAYRALGFHAMTGAFTHSDGSPRWAKLLAELNARLA